MLICMCVCVCVWSLDWQASNDNSAVLKIAGGHLSISDHITHITCGPRNLYYSFREHWVQVLNLAAVCFRVLISYDKDCDNSC